MINTALEAIKIYINTLFPDLKILINWPDPQQKIVYPHGVLTYSTAENKNYTQRKLESFEENGKRISIFSMGEWNLVLAFNYFAKDKIGLDNFNEKLLKSFSSDPVNELLNRSKKISFGTKDYEVLSLTFLGFSLYQTPFGIQTAEDRRSIFRFMADFPDLIRKEIPIMTDIQLSATIKEDVDASN